MNVPENLKYTDHDEWIRVEDDGTLTIGITDFAQDQLGEIVHVDLPDVDDELTQGEMACEVESVKAVGEISSPITGVVVAVNEALEDAPESVNDDPYGAWLFRVRLEEGAELPQLMDASAYSEKVS